MKTIQIELIVKEFFGLKCILRLSNGITITGVMGNTHQNSQTNTLEIALCCENNINKNILLQQIEALKIV